MRLKEWTIEEQEPLIHFLTKNEWPYHVQSHPGRELIERTIEEGGYESDDVKTFWIENDEGQKVGMAQIYDLQDEIPVFDLRIAEQWRGLGYGKQALLLVTEFIFSLPEKKIRLEGHTRQDNVPMRKTFESVGFVKEAHFRDAWYMPKEDAYYDAVTYGITREDFFSKKTTPVSWNDEPVEFDYKKYWDFPSQFETERLVVRIPREEDTELVYEAIERSIVKLKMFMSWAQQKPTHKNVKENIRKAIAKFMNREELRFHLFIKETNEFVGVLGLQHIDWTIPKFEIGYWIDERWSGRGYMTEAVHSMTLFAFEDLGANRLEIRCDRDNIRSRAVAEKNHFELEGILKQDSRNANTHQLRDTCVYAKISLM